MSANRNMPSRAEVIALLNEGRGTVHVWQTLTARYGPPKNTWGSFVQMIIRENKRSRERHAATSVNAPINATANAHNNAQENALTQSSGSIRPIETERSHTGIRTSVRAGADASVDVRQLVQSTQSGAVETELKARIGELERQLDRIYAIIYVVFIGQGIAIPDIPEF
jgi:hypothetical protein